MSIRFSILTICLLTYCLNAKAEICPKEVFINWSTSEEMSAAESDFFVQMGYHTPFEPPHQPWHSFGLRKGQIIWGKSEAMYGSLYILNEDVTTDTFGRIPNLSQVSTILFDGKLHQLRACDDL